MESCFTQSSAQILSLSIFDSRKKLQIFALLINEFWKLVFNLLAKSVLDSFIHIHLATIYKHRLYLVKYENDS